jgi:ABC-type polysaccharide/polyol phosphate transport system ATPase subunit
VATTAVDVRDVSKRFRLYHEKYSSLKEKVIHVGRVPHEDLWALRDVSFDVPEGQTVGILGRNGSGKSTLLKCVCGILQPTSGQVVVRGKLAGLLELGAGFQQELSGRQNVYLNGSMLGFSKRDVDRMFDDIVEFAELGQFIDNQVKYYSSGMYVRLGFAVAVNVDPDVLVIDEVLAVGDERFQRKCIDRVKQFQREGRTILFVSHSPDLVRSICDRAVVLSDGELIGAGVPGEAIRLFRERLLEAGDALGASEAAAALDAAPDEQSYWDTAFADPQGGDEQRAGKASEGTAARKVSSLRRAPKESRPIRFTDVSCVLPGTGRHYLLPGEPVTVRASFDSARAVTGVVFHLEVRGDEGTGLFRTDSEILGVRCDLQPGQGTFEFHLEAVPLLDGAYDVNVGVETAQGLSDWREPGCKFEVMNPGRSTGVVAVPVRAALVGAGGFAVPADGSVAS